MHKDTKWAKQIMAVSKWETNTSYPDITLLCPLARALDTNVDMLLNYEKTLPDEEVVQKINDLLALARTTGWQAAESALNRCFGQSGGYIQTDVVPA